MMLEDLIKGTPKVIWYFKKETKDVIKYDLIRNVKTEFTLDSLDENFGRHGAWCYVQRKASFMYTGGYSSKNLVIALMIKQDGEFEQVADMLKARR
ncbi:MAG: hypothetical protein V2I33_23120, partial [Kangiellaceae bacterium]|nr:hypothetical protein [Kangiellaceae bacterium]